VSLWGARAARGLMHADVRLDNFFFPAGEQGGLLDFQLIKKGCVVDDIA
jgi:Ser/Thr protein kinase RdoA (MazF antagonist)